MKSLLELLNPSSVLMDTINYNYSYVVATIATLNDTLFRYCTTFKGKYESEKEEFVKRNSAKKGMERDPLLPLFYGIKKRLP